MNTQTHQANAQLLSEVMGLETQSTKLYLDGILQVAANNNIPFDKTAPHYIKIKEALDSSYAKCINDYDTQINAIDMPRLTARERLVQNAEYIDSLLGQFKPSSTPREIRKIQNKLDEAYAVEEYLITLPQSSPCNEEDLMEIALASQYQISFDEHNPDFEEMRQKILGCELMVDWLKKELIDTEGLSFDEIKELYEKHDGSYDAPAPNYDYYSARAWG